MTDHQAAPAATDTRFLDALRAVCSAVVDDTGEGRNGELWIERVDAGEWLTGILEQILRDPAGPLARMLAARVRLGENVRLVEDIDVERIRTALLDPDEAPAVSDDISALLDFVAEVRKIAKEI